jgi:hypothetical protein
VSNNILPGTASELSGFGEPLPCEEQTMSEESTTGDAGRISCSRCKGEGFYDDCADDCTSPWCIDPYFDCSPQAVECNHAEAREGLKARGFDIIRQSHEQVKN